MRSISTAQEQFKAQALVDLDGDGVGDYGTLGELSGTSAMRGGGARCNNSPFIAAILGVTDAQGLSQKSGYYYVLYLTPPASPGQEAGWCVYAWPNSRGQSGNRAFFVDQEGTVLASPNTTAKLSGGGTIPTGATPGGDRWVNAGN